MAFAIADKPTAQPITAGVAPVCAFERSTLAHGGRSGAPWRHASQSLVLEDKDAKQRGAGMGADQGQERISADPMELMKPDREIGIRRSKRGHAHE